MVIESGAVGKSEDGRSKEHNKQTAFKRMAETQEFKKWHRVQTAKHLGILVDIEKEVEKSLHPNNLVIEIKNESGCWIREG